MPLTAPQKQIVDCDKRFTVVIAGRRFGKTHLAIRQLCKHASIPNQIVWYCAPTYRQAKMITWRKLRNTLVDLRWVEKINESSLTIDLKNGSTISLKGADNYDSLRGVGINFLCMDEFADIAPEAWYETLRPTLSDTAGKALFIGTPKGMNWAKDLYDLAEEYPDEWSSFTYKTIEGGQVPETEIEAARRTLDERTFRQEYEATWETFTGRVFYAFDRTLHLKDCTAELYNTQRLTAHVHVGMDFNVDNNSAVIAVRAGNILHIMDEIKLRGSNTDEMVDELKTRYPTSQITVYPDPAGNQRKTSASGKTDHTILRAAGFAVKAPHAHHPVRDGINAVNAKLRSSSGEITLFVSPQCKYTIESFEKFTYKEGTSQPDKDSGYDHTADAVRYMVDFMFPIRQPIEPLPIRTWGHKTARSTTFGNQR